MNPGTVAPRTAGLNTPPAATLPAAAEAGRTALSHTVTAQGNAPGSERVSAEAARQAVARINAFVQSSSPNIEFIVDGRSSEVIVRVVDSETNQLIRQIPSAEMLAIAYALDRMTGLLLEQKA